MPKKSDSSRGTKKRSTGLEQRNPTEKPFTPDVLDRTVIAIPLLEKLQAQPGRPDPFAARSSPMPKAFRFHATGGPEVLRLEDVAVGDPGPGQVRMRNQAVAVNYRDILVRRGVHRVAALPSGIGLESAGTIERIGDGVGDLAVGDRVACVAGPDGAYATHRIVPAARVVRLPAAIAARTAAAMMIRGMTARYLLHETFRVKAGDTILVHAAAGGVGLIMCQWAKHLGATVIGTVGSADKAAIARQHGCDHPIVLGGEDVVARVRALTDGRGVPVVYGTRENTRK